MRSRRIIKKDKRHATSNSADFLRDLYGGVYDTALAASNMDECSTPASLERYIVKRIKAYAEIVRQYRASATAVSSLAAEENAPKCKKRALTMMLSDQVCDNARKTDVEEERNEALRRATAERKSYVTLSVCKLWTAQNLTTHVASLAAANEFKGPFGERHRLPVGSCDLVGIENTDEPWKVGVIFADEMTSMTTATLRSRCHCDIAVAFDAREHEGATEVGGSAR